MIIDNIMKDCWEERPPYLLSQDAIMESFAFFKSYLEKKLTGLPDVDQTRLVRIYLYLSGYTEQDPLSNENVISIKYKFSENNQISGNATLKRMINESTLPSADFNLVFDLDNTSFESNLLIDHKIIVIHFNDCIRILSAILVLRLYIGFKYQISQNQDLMKWFFDQVRTMWGVSMDELGEIGNRWNTFSQLKLEWRSLYR